MKKLLALLLAAAMLLTFVACASKPAETQTPAETTTEETAAPAAETETKEEAAAPAASDGKTYKVAMICDSSINDGGWGAACYNAMVAAAEKKGWQTEVTDSISQDSYYDSIVAYCALGYDMIYAPGNQYTDAVLQAAEEYPDVAFALLNGAVDTPEKAVNKNVSSLLPNAHILSLPFILSIYNLSDEAAMYTNDIILYHAACVVTIWPLAFTLPNTLRAAADVKVTMVLSIISMWVFRFGFSYLLTMEFHMGIFGVWVAMTIAWLVRGIFFVCRYKSGRWQKIIFS